MNESPPGWSFEIGAIVANVQAKPPREEREVVLRVADGEVARIYGWQRGSVDGAEFVVWAQGAVLDEQLANSMGLKPAWTRSVFSGVVRVR